MDKKPSSSDTLIADLAVRHWRRVVGAVGLVLVGFIVSWLLHEKEFQNMRNRLSVVEEKLSHPHASEVSEPYMVMHGIAEGDGQNRYALATIDVTDRHL